MARTALILLVLSLGAPLVGCYQHTPRGRLFWGSVGLVTHVKTLSARNRRIMGDPSTIEASHAAALRATHVYYDAELIQPTDPEWQEEWAGGLDAPHPAHELARAE